MRHGRARPMLPLRTIILACLLCGLVGCAAKPVPTKGVVSVGGKPLANATVQFIAQEPSGRNATGSTDARGAFELTTNVRNDGALPGLYKVTILHAEPVELPPGLKDPTVIQEAMARAERKP